MTFLDVVLVVFAAVGFMALAILIVLPFVRRESEAWKSLGGGVVARAELQALPYIPTFGGPRYYPAQTVHTVVVFDDGRMVTLHGNFIDRCVPGRRVTVLINGFGRIRVE